jgi:hypothetical protein
MLHPGVGCRPLTLRAQAPVRNRVCSMTDYLAARIFVVDNGTAGSFTRSLPRECVLPYSVASDEDLVELARRLCSVDDFEFSELKPKWM